MNVTQLKPSQLFKLDSTVPLSHNENGLHSVARHPALAMTNFPEKGRGIVATSALAKGTILEIAPVIRLTKEETEIIKQTQLDTLVFDWPETVDGKEYDSAILLGITMLLNHAEQPNAEFDLDYSAQTMILTTIRAINPGEEITIDYGCDLWFDVKE